MEKETGVLHFSIEGEFLTNLSRTLFIEGTPLKAINILTKGLAGFPESFAIQVISGKKKLTGVNEFNIEDDNTKEKYGIPLDFEYTWGRLVSKFLQRLSFLLMYRARIQDFGTAATAQGGYYRKPVMGKNSNTPLKNDKELFLKTTKELKGLQKELEFVGKIINKGVKDIPLHALDVYPYQEDYGFRNSLSFEELMTGKFDMSRYDKEEPAVVKAEVNRIEQIKETGAEEGNIRETMLDKYLAAQKEIDQKLEEKIKPNPITDMNSAGWLAPNGDWYGLNGQIANMLHNTITDALKEAGIIPDKEKFEGNPYQFLNEQGWARVHGHDVLYDGYFYKQKLTDKQIEALYQYGQRLQPASLCLGWKKINISAVRIKSIDKILFKTKYFKL